MSNLPHYSKNKQQGRRGVRIVEHIIGEEFEWLFREMPEDRDFGVDAHIEIVEPNGQVTGKLIAAQIKCGESFLEEKNDDGYIYREEDKSRLNYYLNHSIPIIIVICHPKTRECWWEIIVSQNIHDTGKGWKMVIPFNQRLNRSSIGQLTWIARPHRDYASEMEMFWAVNKAIVMTDLLMHLVTKVEILDLDTRSTHEILERTSYVPQIARESYSKIAITIEGYNDDDRELYEIPEVRAWFRKLTEETPYIMYFANLTTNMLIAASYCQYTKHPNGLILNSKDLTPFLNYYLGKLVDYALSLGYTEGETEEMVKSIMSYFFTSR